MPLDRVGTIQLLADQDPDVDAIFRLTRPLPFTFAAPQSQASLVLPPSAYAPTNAQAAIHTYAALWSTLLPVTVHGRVADIWRGYMAQRVFHDLGLAVVFAAQRVNQTRNAHNYLADMSAEQDLYFKAGDFTPIRAPAAASRPDAVLPTTIADEAPPPQRDGDRIEVMGQFNYVPCTGCLETWTQSWASIAPAVGRYDLLAAVPMETLLDDDANGTARGGEPKRPGRILRYGADKGFY